MNENVKTAINDFYEISNDIKKFALNSAISNESGVDFYVDIKRRLNQTLNLLDNIPFHQYNQENLDKLSHQTDIIRDEFRTIKKILKHLIEEDVEEIYYEILALIDLIQYRLTING